MLMKMLVRWCGTHLVELAPDVEDGEDHGIHQHGDGHHQGHSHAAREAQPSYKVLGGGGGIGLSNLRENMKKGKIKVGKYERKIKKDDRQRNEQ